MPTGVLLIDTAVTRVCPPVRAVFGIDTTQ